MQQHFSKSRMSGVLAKPPNSDDPAPCRCRASVGFGTLNFAHFVLLCFQAQQNAASSSSSSSSSAIGSRQPQQQRLQQQRLHQHVEQQQVWCVEAPSCSGVQMLTAELNAVNYHRATVVPYFVMAILGITTSYDVSCMAGVFSCNVFWHSPSTMMVHAW
jgi:hypothetical protein